MNAKATIGPRPVFVFRDPCARTFCPLLVLFFIPTFLGAERANVRTNNNNRTTSAKATAWTSFATAVAHTPRPAVLNGHATPRERPPPKKTKQDQTPSQPTQTPPRRQNKTGETRRAWPASAFTNMATTQRVLALPGATPRPGSIQAGEAFRRAWCIYKRGGGGGGALSKRR